MTELHDVSFTVNGVATVAKIEARLNLVDFLRQHLGLTGTHVGCEHGVCGACTILIDGRTMRSCLMFAVQADGSEIETIEGLTQRNAIADLQDEFVTRNAMQCGFCTSGILATATEVLRRGQANREQIREALSGNYCRCTGYHAIVDAIEAVVARRSGGRA
jgi:aerobic carbon-monoxide dehydrogenase small subunit